MVDYYALALLQSVDDDDGGTFMTIDVERAVLLALLVLVVVVIVAIVRRYW